MSCKERSTLQVWSVRGVEHAEDIKRIFKMETLCTRTFRAYKTIRVSGTCRVENSIKHYVLPDNKVEAFIIHYDECGAVS